MLIILSKPKEEEVTHGQLGMHPIPLPPRLLEQIPRLLKRGGGVFAKHGFGRKSCLRASRSAGETAAWARGSRCAGEQISKDTLSRKMVR